MVATNSHYIFNYFLLGQSLYYFSINVQEIQKIGVFTIFPKHTSASIMRPPNRCVILKLRQVLEQFNYLHLLKTQFIFSEISKVRITLDAMMGRDQLCDYDLVSQFTKRSFTVSRKCLRLTQFFLLCVFEIFKVYLYNFCYSRTRA